jgi:hypothetical protein
MAKYLVELGALLRAESNQSHALTLAALALGPRDRGLPPGADLAHLASQASETGAEALDLAIAWGCGWRRAAEPQPGWDGRWVGAVLALASLVRGSVNQAVRWLGGTLLTFQEALQLGGMPELDEKLEGYTDAITLALLASACRCGHGNRAVRLVDGSCGREEHCLDSWQPEVCSLAAFVATAVRGSAQTEVRSGAFGVSMLSGHLRDDHLLRIDMAEFRVCHECNWNLIRLAVERRRKIEISSLQRGLYDLSYCPACEQPPDPEKTYHMGRKNWLIVPADWGGQHQAAHRYHCMACGNLFATNRPRCPLCGWRVRDPHRLTAVWVRVLGRRRRVA